MTMRFQLGQIVMTPAALDALRKSGEEPSVFVGRHQACDWGAVCSGDARANDDAVAHEGDLDRQQRVLSSYTTKLGETIWIITEADRSSSCLLLPSDY